MSELLVTQCPYCQTRFRLTPEQLNVAAGKVRCGACLEVFQALEKPLPSAATAIVDTPVALGNTTHGNHNLLDEPDLEALGLDDSIIAELNPVTRSEPWLVEDPSAAHSSFDHDPLGDLHDEFLAATPARDFGPEHVLHTPAKVAFSATQTAIEQDTVLSDHTDSAQSMPTITASQRSDRTEQPFVDPDPQGDDDARREPSIGSLAAVDLFDEELFYEPLPRRSRRRWLWGSLCLLALLALPAQFVYYNFDAIARDQRLRPMLENLCLLVACEMPTRVDISLLRSANLLVRADAEFPNALAIDVILYNRADFAQPFPVLQMQFTDAGGRTLASRRFRPEEYLSGELAGVQLMPTQTPIHVALSMLNPGPQASGYSLEFVSP